MKTVDIRELKTNLSRLLALLQTDSETIVICRNGKPVADLVPHHPASRSKPHPVLGKIKIGYDPVESLAGGEWPARAR